VSTHVCVAGSSRKIMIRSVAGWCSPAHHASAAYQSFDPAREALVRSTTVVS
jgi:hypothetical protein